MIIYELVLLWAFIVKSPFLYSVWVQVEVTESPAVRCVQLSRRQGGLMSLWIKLLES